MTQSRIDRALAAARARLQRLPAGQGRRGSTAERPEAEPAPPGEECLVMGDDLIDIPMFHQAGISVAVGDAAPEAAAEADWQTTAPGGRGAVREAAVWLLKQQGRWADVTARYYTRKPGAAAP